MSSRRSDSAGAREPNLLPRSFIDAWRGQQPPRARIHLAYQAFLASSAQAQPRKRPVMMLRWLVLGLAVGVGSVHAATVALRSWENESSIGAPAPTPSVKAMPRRKPAPRVARKPPLEEPASLPVPSAGARSPEVPAKAGREGARDPWKRAAEGLRNGDLSRADAALGELMRSGSDDEREAAQLARAQVMLRQGQTQAAEQLLRALRSSARSALVRAQAAELLARQASLPSHRSF